MIAVEAKAKAAVSGTKHAKDRAVVELGYVCDRRLLDIFQVKDKTLKDCRSY